MDRTARRYWSQFDDWTLGALMRHAHLTPEAAAVLLDRTPRTLDRWNDHPPATARRLLLAQAGELGAFHGPWAGWRLFPDGLMDLDGNLHHTLQIRKIPFYKQLSAEYDRLTRAGSQRDLFQDTRHLEELLKQR